VYKIRFCKIIIIIIIKINFHDIYTLEVILYWYFITSWNQTGVLHLQQIHIVMIVMGLLLQINLYPTNALDPFKSASYKCTKWVHCGHLNAPHSHVQS